MKKVNHLKSLNDVVGKETNPFVFELKGKMYLQPRANAVVAKGQAIVDTITGEVLEENVLIGRRKTVDKSQFAKIYASEIAMLFGLSKSAINVFLYLTKVMDYENKALFDYNKEFKKLNYKTNVQPLNGLRELITKGIIHPHLISGIWWLNPAIVCKGERFATYTEYVTKEYEEKEVRRKLEEDKKEIYKSQNNNRRAGYIAAGAYEVTEKEDYAEAAKHRDSNNKIVPKESDYPSRYDRLFREQDPVEQQQERLNKIMQEKKQSQEQEPEEPSRWVEHSLINDEEIERVVIPQEEQE